MLKTFFGLVSGLILSGALAQSVTYRDFTFEPAPVVKLGEPLTVGFTVENIGREMTTATPILFVGETEADAQEVDLGAGEAKRVQFTLEFTEVGNFAVRVAALPPQMVKVFANPRDAAVLHLSFDDPKNLARDVSGFENHGTVKGGVRRVEGAQGSGVSFANEQAFIELPASSSLNVTGDALTMMIWIKPQNEEGYSDFFTQGDWNVLKLQDPETLNLFAGGWRRGEAQALVPENWNNRWHHVAGVSDSGELRLYVDGELTTTLEVAGEIPATPFSWNVGRNAQEPEERGLNGALDDARVYPVALSQEDIQSVIDETHPK